MRLASVVVVFVVVVSAHSVVLAFQPSSCRLIGVATSHHHQAQPKRFAHPNGRSRTARWQDQQQQAQHGEIGLRKSARSGKVSVFMLNNKEQGFTTSEEILGQNESDDNSNRHPSIHDDGLLRQNRSLEQGSQRGNQGLEHSHFQQNNPSVTKQQLSRFRSLKQKLAHFFLAARRKKLLVLPGRGRRRQFLSLLRKRIATVAFAIALVMGSFLSAAPPAWAGVSGGRMGGGSFKSGSSSPSRSRPMGGTGGRTTTMPRPPPSSPYGRVHYMPSPRIHHHIHVGPRPPVLIDQGWHAGDPRIVMSQPRVRVKDIVVLTGTGALLAYGFRNNYRQNNGGGVGARKGTTVGSLTVALDVRRDKPDNILDRFSRLANRADTDSQRGLQELLSNVALELLRNEKSITSARAQSKNYASRSQAEREFQLLSVQGRSKVDRLTGM